MKTICTIVGLVSILFVFTKVTFCQNTFEYTIKDTLTDEIVNDAIELEDGSYILACERLPPLPTKAHLIRLSKSGKLLGSADFNYQGQPSGFLNILQINTNKFLLAGFTFNGNKYDIWLYSMDSLFNEIDSKVIGLNTCSLYSMNILSDESGDLLCHGVLKDPSNFTYAFIYKFSSSLDSLQFKIFTDHQIVFQSSLLRKVGNTGYYFFLMGYREIFGGYNEAILDLDNSLSINQVNGVPHLLSGYPNSKWINNNAFILTGRKDSSTPNDRCSGVMRMDTVFALKNELDIGDHDTIEWQGMRKNLDFIDTNSIYVAGTHNFCQWEYCNVKSWYSLTNLNSILNVRWQKFFGGTADYTLWGLLATKDGGCLLFGTIYDPATQNNERDVYVIKVNQGGLVGGTDDKTKAFVHDAIVYPNPGSDYVNVESGPQISGAEFQMVSIEGRNRISKTLSKRKTIVETKSLPSGIYIWQIIYHGIPIDNGKWIKE